MKKEKKTIFQTGLLMEALKEAFKKLNPLTLKRNPVMLIVEIGSILTTVIVFFNIFSGEKFSFNLQVSIWLWFTIIFANFAESLAEIQSKARAETLRKARSELFAKKLLSGNTIEKVSAMSLRKDDIILIEEGDIIPGDGEIIEGTALVDESAITGESAPVIRESGGDRSSVTGGTKLLSGTIKVKITSNPGETFMDNLIKMVESSKRQKTPNEIALELLLIIMTLLFIVVVFTIPAIAGYMGVKIAVPVLVALLVCLMPTTIGGLLPAIGIAGMDRLLQYNVIAVSGRAVEAAGDVNIVLLDKTGTITLGNRMASEFIPSHGIEQSRVLEAALFSSLSDETPEGRSIITLCKKETGTKGSDIRVPEGAVFVPFTPQSRMSGVDIKDRKIRKGSIDAIEEFVESDGGNISEEIKLMVDNVAKNGDTPLVISENNRVLGIIRLKDIVKMGIRERLAQLRKMGIKSVMITGDNPLTAASIAAEAGLDDFLAGAKPETKLSMIRKYQTDGNLVAMIGDGTNDAPALAQADVAVAMNAGTQAAREAANMVDLDSNPTKLLDIVEIGKQILITRGALTTFSVANDVSKYFAIIPAMFAVQYPELNILNVMHLGNPSSAILSAVIFNAVIIPCLIPLSLRGVKYEATSVTSLLRMNLLVYGLGGLILPFICIKIIDLLVILLKLA
ncbi:MAG: potassium-transporting ATPase subunit KdpB [Candidatus Eremiobacterota bacterium]